MKTTIFDIAGKEVGKMDLPKEIFEKESNDTLMREVIIAIDNNSKTNASNTKTKGEVRGGGRKPWKQKGTGRARHGSIRSPLWVGGGITFGPRGNTGSRQKMNKKVRSKALLIGLSEKAKENKIIFIDKVDIGEKPKTKIIHDLLQKIKDNGYEKVLYKGRSALFVLSKKDDNFVLSARNVPNTSVTDVTSLNASDVLTNKYIIFINPDEVMEKLKGRII